MKAMEKAALAAAELAGDERAAADVKAHAAATRLARKLAEWRMAKGLTQRQLAAAMGTSASKVSRIESARDADLNWGDAAGYAEALGLRISVLLDDPNLPAAERIKHHVLTTHGLLEDLVVLAEKVGAGDEIAGKIRMFYGDVLINFLLGFADNYSRLPGPVEMEPDGAGELREREVAASGAALAGGVPAL
jgi:transcriptional regulator with XRE-family HTH domain